MPSPSIGNKPSTECVARALVVSAIHVGVALAASAILAGKAGSQEMSGGKASRGGIAKNTAPALQLLRSPPCRLDWSNKQAGKLARCYAIAKGNPKYVIYIQIIMLTKLIRSGISCLWPDQRRGQGQHGRPPNAERTEPTDSARVGKRDRNHDEPLANRQGSDLGTPGALSFSIQPTALTARDGLRSICYRSASVFRNKKS